MNGLLRKTLKVIRWLLNRVSHVDLFLLRLIEDNSTYTRFGEALVQLRKEFHSPSFLSPVDDFPGAGKS